MFEDDLWFAFLKLSNRKKLMLLDTHKDTNTIRNYLKDIKFIEGPMEPTKIDYNKLLENYLKSKTNLCIYGDKNYPTSLLEFEDSPSFLYYKGDISKINLYKNVAIIGARNSTIYGKSVTRLIAKELVKQNINIISGLARGIDTIAHETACDSNGYTCAVLGCGIDIIYPKENWRLYDLIGQRGLILSEFLPGTMPLAYNFPQRNRIISGLSSLIVVTEAGEKSGTLNTVDSALKQNKEVYVVPGSILNKESLGTNRLIRDGAGVITDIDDLLFKLGSNIPSKNKETVLLDEKENNLISLISYNPIHIDELKRITNIDIKHLYGVLFELQLKKEVICLSGNYYVKS
ncbi:MAG TPA: DNA-processing protein DprA [Clostridiaceae bacterium]